jgi:hypothetical protein
MDVDHSNTTQGEIKHGVAGVTFVPNSSMLASAGSTDGSVNIGF